MGSDTRRAGKRLSNVPRLHSPAGVIKQHSITNKTVKLVQLLQELLEARIVPPSCLMRGLDLGDGLRLMLTWLRSLYTEKSWDRIVA